MCVSEAVDFEANIEWKKTTTTKTAFQHEIEQEWMQTMKNTKIKNKQSAAQLK